MTKELKKEDKYLYKTTTKLNDEEFSKMNKVFPNLYLNLVKKCFIKLYGR